MKRIIQWIRLYVFREGYLFSWFSLFVIKVKRWLVGDWWVVRKCKFPFPKGYATYNRKRKMILDTGLTKLMAKETCKELNE